MTEKKPDGAATEPKAGVTDRRTVKEKLEADAARLAESGGTKGKPNADAVMRDANVPNALAAGKVSDVMPGVTNPREVLDDERTGAEMAESLRTAPHPPKIDMIDGEPLDTGRAK